MVKNLLARKQRIFSNQQASSIVLKQHGHFRYLESACHDEQNVASKSFYDKLSLSYVNFNHVK